MPLFPSRARGCGDSPGEPSARTVRAMPRVLPAPVLAPLVLAALTSGCLSYEPLPVEPLELLHELEEVRWPAPGNDAPEPEGASTRAPAGEAVDPGPAQLATFAVSHNPALEAVRAQVGVSQALLVEAGLLPDPEIGWDGMDALAAEIVDGTTSRLDYLSGIGLSIQLPRPGELGARRGAARWRIEEALRQVTLAEWRLARDVQLACQEVLAAEQLLRQNGELTQVVESTYGYFQRAQEAGTATAIESSLAHGDLLNIQVERLRLESRAREARQGLNALLGLPPDTALKIRDTGSEIPDSLSVLPTELAELAVTRRPDLGRLLAVYQAAEEELRLEVALQFPQISIGTGLWIVPGFLRGFNHPAIRTAVARREKLHHEVEAAVHEVRRDVHDAWAELQEARQELAFLEQELLPNAEESLRLAGEAFTAGEATLLEILNVQRALVDARTRHAEARADRARRVWHLMAATGLILTDADSLPERDDEQTDE